MLALMAAILAPASRSTQESPKPQDVVVRDWLVLLPVDVAGRRPIRCDAVFADHLLARDSKPPVPGAKRTGELGKEATWEELQAKDSGEVEGEFGWACSAVESASSRVVLAELSGASTLFVNGAAFAGDAYRYVFRGVPISLREGRNDVYVTGIRGKFSLRLREPEGPLIVGTWDTTLPDARAGDGAVLVLNATEQPMELSEPSKFTLAPLQATKVPFSFDASDLAPSARFLPIEVAAGGENRRRTEQLRLEIAGLGPARRTFRSRIDGSVQPYAVLPPSATALPEDGFGIVLTLHGAGVDALGQVRSYSAKPDLWIVAPTNRRPYGFDWQDWGRLDAYEVLDRMLADVTVREERVYLTGHSMGGHGTWHLAANDPDRFVAIAPSAGWISFDTYGGRPKGSLADLWQRADGASRTLDLLKNFDWTRIYILHGDADDNVPISEAREMEKSLQAASAKWVTFHAQQGAGHWWDGDASPGVDCVDWPPIFESFRGAGMRKKSDRLRWTSVDPSVDAEDSWVEVAQPLEYGRSFSVEGERGFTTKSHDIRQIQLQTANVRRLRITASRWSTKAEVTFDGVRVDASGSGWFLRTERGWAPDEQGPPPDEKSPSSSGPFKRAFDREFLLVIGTQGDELEDRELLELARYEAEVWWYRGNGTARIYTDSDFLASEVRKAPRNVILFGNEDTNSAWKIVLSDRCPIRARRGSIELRGEKHEGAGLACLFVFPRADAEALVGAFADSGPAGTRLLTTVPVFVSGVGLPDFTLFGPEVLERGDDGVIAAGWFDFAWR